MKYCTIILKHIYFVNMILHEILTAAFMVTLAHYNDIQHLGRVKKSSKSIYISSRVANPVGAAKLYCKRTVEYISFIESARDILTSVMKRYMRRFLIFGIGLLLAIFSAALTYSIAIQSAEVGNNIGAALFLQATPPPQEKDQSEVGSTDEIVALGGIIVLIVVVPILLRRKYWMRQPPQ